MFVCMMHTCVSVCVCVCVCVCDCVVIKVAVTDLFYLIFLLFCFWLLKLEWGSFCVCMECHQDEYLVCIFMSCGKYTPLYLYSVCVPLKYLALFVIHLLYHSALLIFVYLVV